MKAPVRLVMSGAAGQISYAAIFKLFSGEVFGKDQPVHLVMLEIPAALKFCDGVVMEAEDCAFPCYGGVTITDSAEEAFKDADYAVLFGAFPRGPGMQRADLLAKNKGIFEAQGEAIKKVGKPDLRVLVVGNPANTNACILRHHATNLKPMHVTAMSRLDHNRLVGQIAKKLNVPSSHVKGAYVLGNHSNTMVPVMCSATVDGKRVVEATGCEWAKQTMELVRNRGSAVIEARGGKSSAASAAEAAMNHMRDWYFGTADIVSASLESPKDNKYNVPEGIFFSYPCTCENGEWKIASIEHDSRLDEEIKKTIDDLVFERKTALGF